MTTSELSEGRFVLVTHEVGTVPVQQVMAVLKPRTKGGLLIHHPLQFRGMARSKSSYSRGWGDVRAHDEVWFPRRVTPEVLSYLKDFLLTIFWVLRARCVFDVMIAAGNLNAFAGLTLRWMGLVRKVVYYAIDFSETRFSNRFLEACYRKIDEIVLCRVDATWHLSHAMKGAREHRFPRAFTARGGRHQLVPVGVHASRMRGVARHCLDATERIVFLGNILESHGLGVVIEALSILCREWPRLMLDIYGDGPDKNLVQAQVHSLALSDRVTFHGYIEADEVLEVELGRGGIAVAMYAPHLSTFSRFADPGKIKMYLGAGLPIVMTSIPPIAGDLDGDCAIISLYSSEACATAIRALLSNPERYCQMRSRAFSVASGLEWETITLVSLAQLSATSAVVPLGGVHGDASPS